MADFLLYDVWGGLIYNIPSLALSIFVGWRLAVLIVKGKKLDKKYTKLLTFLIAVVMFILLKSLMN